MTSVIWPLSQACLEDDDCHPEPRRRRGRPRDDRRRIVYAKRRASHLLPLCKESDNLRLTSTMNHLSITSPWRCTRLWLLGAVAAPIVLAVAARAEPAMWVIRDKDSTIYLIGTL